MFLDPRLVAVFSVLFLALGIFNLVLGRKRLAELRARGEKGAWFKQLGILTGTEYILLGVVLLLRLGVIIHFFPDAMNGIYLPLYIILLGVSAAVLGAMLFFSLKGSALARRFQMAVPFRQTVPATVDDQDSSLAPTEKAANVQKHRERRQKAAEARRRRAGRA